MTFRIVKLKRTGNHYPYESTQVPLEKSIAAIKILLTKHGCTRIAEMTDHRGKEALVTLAWEQSGIPFMVEFPIIYAPGGAPRMDVSGRIIHDRIKAMLIEVEIDLWSFVQAMSPFIALPGPDGKAEPMYEYITEHGAALTKGLPLFPQLGGGS